MKRNNPDTDTLTIRTASAADVPLILSFIKELAAYEQLPHRVKATEAQLRQTLFGEHSYAEVIFACVDQQEVGFALFFHNYSTYLAKAGIYLEDIFVKPEMRGKGIGRRLLAYLAHLAKKRNCGRLEWWVLDSNTSAVNFYKSIGAKPMDAYTVHRLTEETLDRLAMEWS